MPDVEYQPSQLPCGIFSAFAPLNDSSSETFYFMSSHCISNRLQFAVTLAWIIVVGLSMFFAVFLLLKALRSAGWNFTVSCITLCFACGINVALFLIQISYFFGFRGYGRVFCGGLILVILIPGVTYVIKEWYLKIFIATQYYLFPMAEQERLAKIIKRSFWIFNIAFGVCFFTAMFAAGAYDVSDINKNNLAIGVWYLVSSVFCIFLASGIMILGRNVVNAINSQSNHMDQNAQNNLKRIQQFYFFQSLIIGSTSIIAFAFSIWAFVSYTQSDKNLGMPYYWYLQQFVFFPCFIAVFWFFVYLGTTKPKTRANNLLNTGKNPITHIQTIGFDLTTNA